MGIRVTDTIRKRIFVALLAVGMPSGVAYMATTSTVDSEGFMLERHKDPVGKTTVGVGHLVQKGEVSKQTYTEDEVIDIFVKDWVKHDELMREKVKVEFKSDWMRWAFGDFTFNKGPTAFSKATLLQDLNAKRYDKACDRLTDWVFGTVNGKKVKLKGLEVRASKQWKACMGEVPRNYEQDVKRWTDETKTNP